MIKLIDLSKSKIYELPYLDSEEYKDAEGKGWGFSFVYHFSELRDIYLAIKQVGYENNRIFTRICNKDLQLPFVKTKWDERRVLEHVNALKNFNLITSDNKLINHSIFKDSNIGNAINKEDKMIFKGIFFSYFRFKEMMSWFVDPISQDRKEIIANVSASFISERSKVIFPFFRDSKFNDAFLFSLENNSPVFQIFPKVNESSGGILRFWDVFTKWATELDLVEKFNLKNLDFQLEDYKGLSCVYFKREIDESFDLISYIKANYKSKYISIAPLILKIALEHRYSLESIKKNIIETSKKFSDVLSLQRTSEVFIRNTEIKFIPLSNHFYVSHILLR